VAESSEPVLLKPQERAGAPALGNALGYFAALYMISKVDWLGPEHSEIAVAMMGTIFIHAIMEGRAIVRWFAARLPTKK